jgi:CheY-like chemotaxis protein
MMAGQDGWETLQLLKNHPDTHDIPVLICSVLPEHDLARFLGAAELLEKPVTRPALLAALARQGLPVRG